MDCKIVNTPVKDAADKIKGEIHTKFLEAGTTFVEAFEKAIADMRGEAKDELEAFFNESYKDLVSNDESGIPAMIKGLGELLKLIALSLLLLTIILLQRLRKHVASNLTNNIVR